MTEHDVSEVRRAAIIRDIKGGMEWGAAAQKYHLPKTRIAKVMQEELDRMRGDVPAQLPERVAVEPEIVGADEGIFAGGEPPPWDDEPADTEARRHRARARRQRFADDEPGPQPGQRRESIRPDGVFSAGESRHGVPRMAYGPEQRKHLLDRTFEAYADLLDERTEQGGMSAKELQTMAEVFKLLDTQARLSEGNTTEHVQMSDNRDVVRAQIEQIRARRAGVQPNPQGQGIGPTPNEVVA